MLLLFKCNTDCRKSNDCGFAYCEVTLPISNSDSNNLFHKDLTYEESENCSVQVDMKIALLHT